MDPEQFLRSLLWDSLPEARSAIEELEADEQEFARGISCPPVIGIYSYISVAFFYPVFTPAMESGDEDLKGRCFAFLERLLDEDYDSYHGVIAIRVIAKFEKRWMPVAQRLAGPKLRQLSGA